MSLAWPSIGDTKGGYSTTDVAGQQKTLLSNLRLPTNCIPLGNNQWAPTVYKL